MVKAPKRESRSSSKKNQKVQRTRPPMPLFSKIGDGTSGLAFREVAILVAVLAVTCVIFIGILRTRDEGIFSANAAAREESHKEVEKIEKQIQKRLREMSAAMKQSASAGGSGKGKKAKKGPPPVFKHFDPNSKHPLTAEELAELKADIHDILDQNPEVVNADFGEDTVQKQELPLQTESEN